MVPVNAMLAIDNVAVPLLVRVTAWAALVVLTIWLPNERLVGDKLTAAAVPIPDRLTACGLPLALSLMLIEAARLPVAAGVKVTLIVQFAPAATGLPQVFA